MADTGDSSSNSPKNVDDEPEDLRLKAEEVKEAANDFFKSKNECNFKDKRIIFHS